MIVIIVTGVAMAVVSVVFIAIVPIVIMAVVIVPIVIVRMKLGARYGFEIAECVYICIRNYVQHHQSRKGCIGSPRLKDARCHRTH